MTEKQKFMEKFLKGVYHFDEVKFETCSGAMEVIGSYTNTSKTPFGKKLAKVSVPITIWMDKRSDGSYSIKFKTYATHIPMERANEFVRHTLLFWPGAIGVDVYRRCYAGYSFSRDHGAPTLRVIFKVRPWAKKNNFDMFVDFLREHRALETFEKALKKQRGVSLETYRTSVLEVPKLYKRCELKCAFPWWCSEEGDAFWRKLDEEWQAYQDCYNI